MTRNLPKCPICNSNKSVIINLFAEFNSEYDRVINNNTLYSDYSCLDCDEDFNNEDLKDDTNG